MKIHLFQRTKWKQRDLILLLERLELYISSGLQLNKALTVSSQGVKAGYQKSLEKVRKHIEAGGLLSRGLVENMHVNQTIAGLIEHGESSGELTKALGVSRSLLEKEDELRKKCLSAMAYPVIIGIFAGLLTLGLVRGVMPQIIPMLMSLHVELPLLTRIVIFVSEGLTDFGLYVGFVGFGAVVVLYCLYKKILMVKKLTHLFILNIPILGSLVYRYSLAVFLRSNGSLVESGAPIEISYANTAKSVSLIPLSSFLRSKISVITSGIPLSNVLIHKKIPPYIPPLLAAGEASGTLGLSIGRAAGILDRDIEYALKRLTALIEPVMMVAMGTVVGGIALSIMMPIYDISKVLQK